MNDYLELHALYHHGIKGQKWGVRRYQNDDGTLTPEGLKEARIDNKKLNSYAQRSGKAGEKAGYHMLNTILGRKPEWYNTRKFKKYAKKEKKYAELHDKQAEKIVSKYNNITVSSIKRNGNLIASGMKYANSTTWIFDSFNHSKLIKGGDRK